MSDTRPMSASPLDAELVATLEHAFAHHAANRDRLEVADLQRALGLKSEYLAGRILAFFDTDKDGVVSKDEFLDGVRRLVFGTDREKLAFAFQLHDHDGDGFLDQSELYRMIAISLAENDVAERLTQPPDFLARVLMQAADTNRDGRLSFEELEAAVRRRPELLTRLTRSEAIWIAPNEELVLLLEERRTKKRSPLARALENRASETVFLAIWALANVAVFLWSLRFGRASVTYDSAMLVGRAFGACIDLNASLIFVSMMRRVLTWIRPTWLGRVVPVDESITFHKIVGHTLFALAVAHSAAFVVAYARGHAAAGSVLHLFATGRGLTGGVLLLVFAIMWLTSLGLVRRSKRFELFYFTHLLYVVWLGLAIAHDPRMLIFAGIPMLLFVVEQVTRVLRRKPAARALSSAALRSGVSRIDLERPRGFTFGAGDYAFLRIPAIARHEWHPFTISSAPEAKDLSFHVRSLGNWSSALRRLVEDREAAKDITAYIDGPYGSPSARIFSSRFVVLIGAGIGVTPFASVLESLILRQKQGGSGPVPEHVHFIWLNRDQYSFEWFRGLLASLEEQDKRGLLHIELCMTAAHTGFSALGLELAREIMHASKRSDIVTGLRTKTHFGPPDWDAMLEKISELHRPNHVDVFFCGPHGLARTLAPLCARLGMSFHEERF